MVSLAPLALLNPYCGTIKYSSHLLYRYAIEDDPHKDFSCVAHKANGPVLGCKILEVCCTQKLKLLMIHVKSNY